MDYEIVELKEMKVAGFEDVTSNEAPDMSQKIGNLWQKFFQDPSRLKGRVNGRTIGLYCKYGMPSEKDYTVIVGAEVDGSDGNTGVATETIPAGRYARFTVKGDVVKAVGESWGEIWSTPLERTFTGDFEEYQEDCISGNGTVLIYIAIK